MAYINSSDLLCFCCFVTIDRKNIITKNLFYRSLCVSFVLIQSVLIYLFCFAFTDPNEEYFTIRFWMKGCMQSWCYAGGECHFFDWCHAYKMSFQRLDNWCVRLGCVDVVRYYYRPMYASFSEGVKEMDDVNAFHEMCVQGMKDKKVDVYVKHFRDESDLEAREFGRSSLSRLKQVAEIYWESFVEKIDGSVMIYRHRDKDDVEQQPPSCCEK